MTAKEILAGALERPDPAERVRFVAEACGEDSEVWSSLETLIETAATRTIDSRGLYLAKDSALVITLMEQFRARTRGLGRATVVRSCETVIELIRFADLYSMAGILKCVPTT
jgi:hypothetical protein